MLFLNRLGGIDIIVSCRGRLRQRLAAAFRGCLNDGEWASRP